MERPVVVGTLSCVLLRERALWVIELDHSRSKKREKSLS